MKNYEKAQFLIEQLASDGFKFGNAFFHRLEVALDKLDAAEPTLAPDKGQAGDSNGQESLPLAGKA